MRFLWLLPVAATAAAHAPAAGATATPHASALCPSTAASAAHRAAQVCGSLPIEEALRSIRIADENTTSRALAELGFHTALDMQLLAGAPEADELMEALRDRGVRIADRAKSRLLIGGGRHSRQLRMLHTSPILEEHRAQQDVHTTKMQRRMQADSESGISADTLAIVMSVLIGATGYVVQVARVSCATLVSCAALNLSSHAQLCGRPS
eukprot:SAG31_NODE_1810_length_7224_cov_1.969965_3_plen_209_part_00